MSFVDAIDNQEARTENAMKARASSADRCVDFFFKAGALRGQNPIPSFTAAHAENEDVALRILQWARDARGGAGERQIFRTILKDLATSHNDDVVKLISKIPEIGRWDDLLVLVDTAYENQAFDLIHQALNDDNGLCAKWMPRKGEIAAKLRSHFEWTPKFYRKRLVELTKVVETQMCNKEWDEINFSHVPSLAHARYRSAFARNAKTYEAYLEALDKGDPSVKINAGAVYPYDVIKGCLNYWDGGFTGDERAIKAQWEALENFVGDAKVMPLIDTSGSMFGSHYGDTLSPVEVAVSLGLYFADKNQGPFKDAWLNFSTSPKLRVLKGDIIQKIKQMQKSWNDWGGSTNLHAAFELMLKTAVDGNVASEDMPEVLMIFSDMQFNHCVTHDDSAIEMIRRKYREAGYELPHVVFWNLRAADNVPVRFDESGTALVSGASPSIASSILKSLEDGMVSPEAIMLKAVMKERYDLK